MRVYLPQIHPSFIPQIAVGDFLLVFAHQRVRIDMHLSLEKMGTSSAQLSPDRGVCIRYEAAALFPSDPRFVRLPELRLPSRTSTNACSERCKFGAIGAAC
jgi:hypothetical protein